ncbi:sugar phosphate nucleotidyltransferase [Paraburkholderia phymatum]|uniref:Sugar phosphate nucleotidyltransferase n=1 Tax=Paraburkholderia phymatum TaxID=148447 RepID=A0ACC6UDQ4_9BURK
MRAIVLAAGVGSRLRPLTQTRPKAMVNMLGDGPILHRCIRCLVEVGVNRVTVVVGYRADTVREETGDSLFGADISYVYAPDYKSTGTADSFYLAARELTDGVLLIEGDVLFDSDIPRRLLNRIDQSDIAAVAPFRPPLNGTAVTLDNQGQWIKNVYRDTPSGERDGYWKTINIYKFSAHTMRKLCELWERARLDNPAAYFEDMLKAFIDGGQKVIARDCGDCRWFEVDDFGDLTTARHIFGCQSPGG